MTENRPATADERSALGDILAKLSIQAPDAVCRFIDRRWNKVYDVYLVEKSGETYLLKMVKDRREASAHEAYFSGKSFAVPKLHRVIENTDGTFCLLYDYLDGTDAVGCSSEDAAHVGSALAEIQRHHLCAGGQTDQARWYFDRYLSSNWKKFRKYLEEYETTWKDAEARFYEAPQSLVHDDLLPINVLLGHGGPVIIDWATTGVYPYFLDLARFAYVHSDSVGPLLPARSAEAFLAAYYEGMKLSPAFDLDMGTFRRDVTISALYQYIQFLDANLSEPELRASTDFRFLTQILEHLKTETPEQV